MSFVKESSYGVAPAVASGSFIDAMQDSINLKGNVTQLPRNNANSGIDPSKSLTGAERPEGALNFELKKLGSNVVASDLLEVGFGKGSVVDVVEITATGGLVGEVDFTQSANTDKIKVGYPIWIKNVSASNAITAHSVLTKTATKITFTPVLSEAVAASDTIEAASYFESTQDLVDTGTMKVYENGGEGRLMTGNGLAPSGLVLTFNADELAMCNVSGLIGSDYSVILPGSVPAGDKTIINALDFDSANGHSVLAAVTQRIVGGVGSDIDINTFTVNLNRTNNLKMTSRTKNAASANIGVNRTITASISEFADDAVDTQRLLYKDATSYSLFVGLDFVAIGLNNVQSSACEAGDNDGLKTYDQTCNVYRKDSSPVIVLGLR